MRLELVYPEGETAMVRVAIQWDSTPASANDALEQFDRSYWLNNCVRAAGDIVVDYELV
jgi:hypothetical protein